MPADRISGTQTDNRKRLVVRFFISLLLICSAWFLVYNLLLYPGRVIDQPLTQFIAAVSASIINFFSPSGVPVTNWVNDLHHPGTLLVQDGKRVFGIMDACNGIDLMFIYSAVIILLPNTIRRKLAFLTLGNILLVVFNIIRIVSLYFIFRYSRGIFDFSHHYLFTLLMYALIFSGWILFIKNRLHEKSG
jgi:exosortase/archaeosortase family protein